MSQMFHTRIAKKVAVLVWTLYLLTIPASHAEETYYSYLGGSLAETAYAITSDSLNNIYITGHTNSDSFDGFEQVTGKTQFNQNCFVSRINLNSPENNYYFEFAGSDRESCRAIAVDSAFNVYVTGETQSSDLPMTTNKTFGGEWDAFVFKLNPLGVLVYASYIGGSLTDYGHGLALQTKDNVYITGETWSKDFPTTTNAHTNNCVATNLCNGQEANAFVTHIDTSTSEQFVSHYSTYLGGTKQDKAHTIAVDFSGIVHVAGETNSTDFPLTNAISNRLKGKFDGFMSLIDPTLNQQQSLIFSSYLGGNGDEAITAITTDSNGNSYLTGSSTSDDYPTSVSAFSQRCANGVLNCLTSNIKDQHSDGFITQIKNNRIAYSTLFGVNKNDTGHAITVDQTGNIYVSGFTNSNDFPLTDNATDNNCNNSNDCKGKSDSFILKIDPAMTDKTGLQFSTFSGGDNDDNAVGINVNANGRVMITGSTLSPGLASIQALNKTQQNSDAYLQEIEIVGVGNWIDNTPKPVTRNKPSVSGLNGLYLLLLSLIILFLRQTLFIFQKV